MVLVGMHQGDLWLADVEAKIEPHTTRSLLADVHKAPPSTVKVSVPDGWECSVLAPLALWPLYLKFWELLLFHRVPECPVSLL